MRETIRINGMSCGGCVAGVKNALERIGVANPDVAIGSATIEYDESQLSHEQIVDAIEDAGFEVRNGN